ncbi:hypothetical protein PM082_021295 [Marasmius tenuissimus]|nr:hypothetical protein PM082_021295 [Marasmius tenuissimus]
MFWCPPWMMWQACIFQPVNGHRKLVMEQSCLVLLYEHIFFFMIILSLSLSLSKGQTGVGKGILSLRNKSDDQDDNPTDHLRYL